MLDIQFIRENPQVVQEKARQKGYDVDIDKLLELDKNRKKTLVLVEELRSKKNENAEKIKKAGKPDQQTVFKGKKIKEELTELEDELSKIEKNCREFLLAVPNFPTKDVPVGKSEDENVVAKTFGKKPKFNFEPKKHSELAEAKDWMDKERAVKVAGSRFLYIKGDLARLEFALWQFAIDLLTDKKVIQQIIKDNNLKVSDTPFTFILPPAMAKTAVYEATGRLDREETTYKLADDDLWLNASSEHTMAPMYMGEILEEKVLPKRYLGYTTAFRREAGTYGKDMEGMFRLHQFNKLEMESFSTPELSMDEHLFMIAVQEHLMGRLGLPYQVIMKCTADIGFPNARGVDINVWLPGQNQYRETHTADYITDFQARRLKTRFRKADGEVGFVHTNDATAFSERPLIAIIENNQTKEGDVRVPEALQKYLGGKKVI